LGCGNGFTLYALGASLADWKMTGIDFSESLIRGAEDMATSYQGRLRSIPQIVLGDAIAYIRSLPDNSVD